MEDTVEHLENKNPSIKAETALFLSRCFAKCTTASLPKKMLKGYCAPLLKVNIAPGYQSYYDINEELDLLFKEYEQINEKLLLKSKYQQYS